MLKYIKRQINELLDTLTEAKGMLEDAIAQGEEGTLISLLADAQEAATVIGSRIEEAEGLTGEAEKEASTETVGRAAELVGRLERYCELLWELSQVQGSAQMQEPSQVQGSPQMQEPSQVQGSPQMQEPSQVQEPPQVQEREARLALLTQAWGLLDDIRQGVKELPVQYAAVFMPYKASMWDCLESIWQAACDDPDWVPFVVPIPYQDLNNGQVVGSNYEGDKFPPYVPVMAYSVFPLEQIHPEAIFIHNPFDDCNTVTTLLPQHYSAELKKVTDRLIYSPYYVTGEAVYVTHRYLPSYENMDFIVTQCENMIASYSTDIPREKFLPYGSPVADRIQRLEAEKPAIPEEWKPQLRNGQDFGGDRAVMLNASISLLMRQKDRFLDKVEYLLDLAGHTEGITLVWRPHPLLHASARTLGEAYAARLEALEKRLLAEKIGVLDKTLDVGVTVALCDAYLGETASSMIHMFGIAGKPRFYTNLLIPEQREAIDDNFFVSASCETEEKGYYVLDKVGWIVEQDKRTGKIRPFVRIPGRDVVRGRAYRSMEIRDGKVWVYPENAQGIFIYEIDSGRMRKVYGPQGKGETERLIASARIDACARGESSGGAADGPSGSTAGGSSGSAKDGLFGSAEDEPTDSAAGGEETFLRVGEECLSAMRAERFQRGNLGHEWYESGLCSVEDFLHFLRTAEPEELIGRQGPYSVWLASLDGSCGRKVLQAVKDSLQGIDGEG